MKTPTQCWTRSIAVKVNLVFKAFALLAAGQLQTAFGQTYTITDLGTLGGNSEAYAINNFGQVVGSAVSGQIYTLEFCICECDALPGEQCCTHQRDFICSQQSYAARRAFLWTPRTANGTNGDLTDLGSFGGPNSSAWGINLSGQIIGTADTRLRLDQYLCGYDHCTQEFIESDSFLWTPNRANGKTGSMTTLVPLWLYPVAINDAGQIVGGGDDELLIEPDGALTGLSPVHAYNINNNGQVVGEIGESSGRHAAFWQNGMWKDLGTLPGDSNSVAFQINTNGQIVGVSWNDFVGHGFLFSIDSSGTVTERTDLGTCGGSINNRGEVTGRDSIWDPDHGCRQLMTLIAGGSGWTSLDASAINDFGQIVGTGINPSGQSHAFLLTPLPAPRLVSAALEPSGQFRFTLVGEPGRSYTIQASTNLVNWMSLTNFVSITGTNQFTDAAAPNFSRRFYRAVTP